MTGEDRPLLTDEGLIDKLYKRHRLRIMLAITIGYGIVYTCRLALSMVKKPLIDGGIFTPVELGIIGSALFYTYAFGKLTNGFLADHMNLKFFFAFGVSDLGADQHRHGLFHHPLGVGPSVGPQRLVPGVRRAHRCGRHGQLVFEQRTGPDVRHLEHRPRHR